MPISKAPASFLNYGAPLAGFAGLASAIASTAHYYDSATVFELAVLGYVTWTAVTVGSALLYVVLRKLPNGGYYTYRTSSGLLLPINVLAGTTLWLVATGAASVALLAVAHRFDRTAASE